MKVFTVDGALESPEKKTAIASTQLTMMPAYKVVEKKEKGTGNLVKALLFIIFAFLLAAVLTIVISEYAWKKREGTSFFRMRWEDLQRQFQNEPPYDTPLIPVEIDDPSPSAPTKENPHIIVEQPDGEVKVEESKESSLAELAKFELLRTIVDRIRQHNQEQANAMGGDESAIAVISVEPIEGHLPMPTSGEHMPEEVNPHHPREPAIIDDPMDIPIQIHPPMTPPFRHGGLPRPFGPWPSDDYYAASFYPDYQQYPDFLESFAPIGGHNRPRHNGPPTPPFDAREFLNGPESQLPEFAPEPFAAGPPPPFVPRGLRRGRPFQRPPMPESNEIAEGPFSGPSPHFGPHPADFPVDGPNGLEDGPPSHFGPFGGPPPQFGPFHGPSAQAFAPLGASDGPVEEPTESQQPTIRITQHFSDKDSDRPTAIVTEIFGGKKLQRVVGEMIANNAMPGGNMLEQQQAGGNVDQFSPPWMKRPFAINPDLIQSQSTQNINPFVQQPNQMQAFNPFPGLPQIQNPSLGMMNQFNSLPAEISQQQVEMNLQPAMPNVQNAAFFHGLNQMPQDSMNQFRPDMPQAFFGQNEQNQQNMMFPNQVFPFGNNQQEMGQMGQQPADMGNGVMFPPVIMPNAQQQQQQPQPWFNPFEAQAGPQVPNQKGNEHPIDNLDPRMIQVVDVPQVPELGFGPELHHWNEEMLQRNQHRFEGMTPEEFAAKMNISPDMASQQPPHQEEEAKPQEVEQPQEPQEAQEHPEHQEPQQTPTIETALHIDFNDRGVEIAAPKSQEQPEAAPEHADQGEHPWIPTVQLFPASSGELHVQQPAEQPAESAPHDPSATAPEEAPAPEKPQDIPQPVLWNHPSNSAPHPDVPVISRSEGFGKAK